MKTSVGAAALLLALTLAGCAAHGGASAPVPTSYTTLDPGPVASPLQATSRGVLPAVDAGVQVGWDLASSDPASADLDILVTHGACDDVTGAYVQESSTSVILAAFTAAQDHAGEACPAIGVVERWTVRLAAPLGDRALRHVTPGVVD